MPIYTYRREDGSTFDTQQKFLDEPLKVCPTTGQKVVRVVQPAGVIFKGSGFYVTDNGSARKATATTPASSENGSAAKSESSTPKAETSAASSAAD